MLKIKSFHLFFFFPIVLFLQFTTSCNTTEPPSNQTLTLKLADVSCTEAWLQLTTSNLQLPAAINILKNNSVTQTFSLSTQDSLLYIDSLMPNQSYKFKVVINTTNNPQPTTNEVLAQTMDTTSHNFTWQTFEFGQHSSSVLYDVAIIDENNIWAVGEIYMNDSLGNPDPTSYNAVHWNGIKWELKRIKTNACGGVIYPPIKAIFAFSSNDILFAHIDGSISHFNGVDFTNDCSLITQLNGSANKIWGISKNDFYVVSGNGFIAHYNGSSWTKIESGTVLNINDIWGVKDDTGNNLIYCSAYDFGSGGEKKLLKMEKNKIGEVNWAQNKELYTCWFNTPHKLYAGGEGLFYKIYENWKEEVISHYFIFRVRGNGLNDIWTSGGFGFAAHFNGNSWKIFNEISLVDGNYIGLTVKQNIVTLVGQETRKAVITIGK